MAIDKEKIKLIIFDLDGTLTPSKTNIEPAMAALVCRLLEQVRVVVTSGGTFERFKKQFLDWLSCPEKLLKQLYLLPNSGTKLYLYKKDWQCFWSDELSATEKEKILSAFQRAFSEWPDLPRQITGELLEDRGSQITFSGLGSEAPLAAKLKWDPTRAKRQKLRSLLKSQLPEFEINIGGTTSIDVTRRGLDKASGIEKLCQRLAVPLSQAVFVGDALFPGGNDEAVKRLPLEIVEVSGPGQTAAFIEKFMNSP